jgi:hypothetical protein
VLRIYFCDGHSYTDCNYWVPAWVHALDAAARYDVGGGRYVPNFSNTTFRSKLYGGDVSPGSGGIVKAFADWYNALSATRKNQVARVEIGVGSSGEALQPARDWTGWASNGHTTTTWEAYVKKVIDAYCTAFTTSGALVVPLTFLCQTWNSVDGDMDFALYETLYDYAAAKDVNVSLSWQGAKYDDHNWWRSDAPEVVAGYYKAFEDYTMPPNNTRRGQLEWYGWAYNGGSGQETLDSTGYQVTYWRVLAALHCGASWLGVYDGGQTPVGYEDIVDSGNETAFNFFNLRAGKSVTDMPDAWIAFKQSMDSRDDGTLWRSNRDNLHWYMDQYSPTTTTVSNGNIDNSIYGMTARSTNISGGLATFYLTVDNDYIPAGRTSATIYVRYRDTTGSFTVYYNKADDARWDLVNWNSFAWGTTVLGIAGSVTKTNTGNWLETSFSVSDFACNKALTNSSDIMITAATADLTLHMVRVAKTAPSQQSTGLVSVLIL